MSTIHFFLEDVATRILHKRKLYLWIETALLDHGKTAKNINFVFTSDNYLSELNQSYLNHSTYTDILTFDQSANKRHVEADIFISIDRIKENAKILRVRFEDELHRVMIHGVLHLLGYNDSNDQQKEEMRKKENHYLALRF